MTIPIISSLGDVFLVEWDKEKIKMSINRLAERTEGTTAEVLITKDGDHLYHARANLLSPHSKKVLANELSKRTNHTDPRHIANNLDWETMLEQAFTKTLQQYRRGEPIVTVGNLPKRETPRYRLKPLLLEKQLTAIYAHGGSCKSLLSLLLALLVHCGVSLLGFKVIKGNSLILDWETSIESANEKVKAIKEGLGIECKEMPYYRRCFHLLTHDITEIQKEVIEKDIQLVIIDSVGMASGFDKDYHSVAIELLRALRSLDITVLLIDHKPKSGESMFGSVYKYNECRATFELKATQQAGSNIADIGIFHTKFNDTPKHKPIGFHIEFEGDEDYTERIIFSEKDVSDIPELEGNLPQKQRVINILKQGAMPMKDISEETGIPIHSVRTVLSRYKDIFVKTENGWGLLLKALDE